MNTFCIILLLVIISVVLAQDCTSVPTTTILSLSLPCVTRVRVANPYGSVNFLSTGTTSSVSAVLTTARSNSFKYSQDTSADGIYTITVVNAGGSTTSSTTSSKSSASHIGGNVLSAIAGATIASHLSGNSWHTTALAAASTLLLCTPLVSASCSTSASLSINFPSGTVYSQSTSNPNYIEVTFSNVPGQCSNPTPSPVTPAPTSGPTPSPTPTPVPGSIIPMRDTTIIFGSLTPAGFGGVRLSAMDNHTFGASFSGLGLLAYGSVVPQSWNVVQTAGDTTHWVLPPMGVAEGVNAITPKPTAVGAKASLNSTTYTFTVQALNSSGLVYDSATLTIKILAGAVNFGTYDSPNTLLTSMTNVPDTILLSTGADRTTSGLFFIGFNFSHTVTFRNADSSRPAGIAYINLNQCNNWLISGVMFTGDLINNYAGIIGYIASTNVYAVNVTAYFTETTQRTSAAIQFGGCVNCGVTDYYAFKVSGGVVDNYSAYNANISVTRFKLRQFSNNAIFLGNAVNMTFTDCVTMAPMRINGFHLDHIQCADGNSPQNLKIIRHQQYNAEGTGEAQGFFSGSYAQFIGFIDDGSGNGTYTGNPGKILTLSTAKGGYTFYGASWIIGDHFPAVRTASRPPGNTALGQYALALDTPISAPPGNVTNAPFSNLVISGLVYTGNAANVLGFRGLSGNSLITAFTAQLLNPIPSDVPISHFEGTIEGSQLNVTYWDPSNVFPLFAPSTVLLANGSKLAGGNGVVTAGNGGVGIFTLGQGNNYSYPTTTAFIVIGDGPVSPGQGPTSGFFGLDVAQLYTGNTVMSNGYMWASYPRGRPSYLAQGVQVARPPSITVAADTLFQNASTAVAALCFAQGDPEFGSQGLELINNAQWAAMSFQQVITKHVLALTPRVGGPLTNGGSDQGAFTRSGLWNDGSGVSPVLGPNVGSF